METFSECSLQVEEKSSDYENPPHTMETKKMSLESISLIGSLGNPKRLCYGITVKTTFIFKCVSNPQPASFYYNKKINNQFY